MQSLVIDRDGSVEVDRPELDEFGLLRYHGQWVALTSTEERMLKPLLDSWREVVPGRELAEAVWPGGGVRATSVHTLLTRLRRRVRPLGLAIETIRARGFLMEPQRDHP